MDLTQRFIQTENIRLFSEKLYAELVPEKRDFLQRLLVEEEDRFGYYSWHFDLALRHIRDCTTRLEAQRTLIARMQADGKDVTVANELLAMLAATLEAFRDFSKRVARELKIDGA